MRRTPLSSTTAVRSRPLTALAVSVVLALSLSGCGENESDSDSAAAPEPSASQSSEQEPSATESPTTAPAEEPDDAIQITFEGNTVSPNGDRVKVSAGEKITLAVTADAPGELHVHSTPEQVLAYNPGTSDLSLTLDVPGIVEVESHELGVVVVQLEVR